MNLVVSKFGGTSLADADQIKRVLDIIRRDPARKIIVVSAPGKRNPLDTKVTDLLANWYECIEKRRSTANAKKLVRDRFTNIVGQFPIHLNIAEELAEINRNMCDPFYSNTPDYLLSRGEYLMGLIFAQLLEGDGFKFLDSRKCIYLDGSKAMRNAESRARIAESIECSGGKVIIPGFYGTEYRSGSLWTFPRGGSDITGALVAEAVNADTYENWTDVNGVMYADPRIVSRAETIPSMTYRELRELAYGGANVFHHDAVEPVRKANIPTRICNTNDPLGPITLVVNEEDRSLGMSGRPAIAGRTGFTVIVIQKTALNEQVGFVSSLLNVLKEYEISFEHMPTGIDSVSLVISSDQINGKLETLIARFGEVLSPDSFEVTKGIALISVVAQGMSGVSGYTGVLNNCLDNAHVKRFLFIQDMSGISTIIGVPDHDLLSAIQSIDTAFK